MKGTRIIILAAAVAAIAAPSGLADSGTSITIPSWLSKLEQPGTVTYMPQFENFRGGPTGVYESVKPVVIPSWLSKLRQPGATSSMADFEGFRGGPGAAGPVLASDYLGHTIGGPSAAGPVIRVERTPVARGGFDWADAGVGAGFAAAIALLAAAVLIALRSRRTPAHV